MASAAGRDMEYWGHYPGSGIEYSRGLRGLTVGIGFGCGVYHMEYWRHLRGMSWDIGASCGICHGVLVPVAGMTRTNGAGSGSVTGYWHRLRGMSWSTGASCVVSHGYWRQLLGVTLCIGVSLGVE